MECLNKVAYRSCKFRQYIFLCVWTATDDSHFMLFWHKYFSRRYCNRRQSQRTNAYTHQNQKLLEKTNLSILEHKKICKSVNNPESAIDNGNKVTVTFLIMAIQFFFFIATLGSFDIWTGWWLSRHDWSSRPSKWVQFTVYIPFYSMFVIVNCIKLCPFECVI